MINKVKFNVEPTKKNNLWVACYFKDFYVGRMRGMLICDNCLYMEGLDSYMSIIEILNHILQQENANTLSQQKQR